MAETSIDCSVTQGFNFENDIQSAIGHITALKIGDKEFTADISVTDPENVAGDPVPVVGIMSNIYWEGGYSHSINFNCQISNTNQVEVSTLVDSELSDTNVEFQFNVYRFDPKQKKFYKAVHTNDTALLGIVEKQGSKLNIRIDDNAGYEVTSPINFTLQLGVNPQEQKQDIHLAFSVDAKKVKPWGVQVG